MELRNTTLCALLVTTAIATATVPAAAQGISADLSVAQLPYSNFEGQEASALWDTLNGSEFWAIPRTPPADYDDSANSSSANALRQSLHDIIDNHTIYNYTHRTQPSDANHRTDVWDVMAIADAHPESPDEVLDIYLNNTFNRQLRGQNTDPRYDREHSWPKSLGFPDDTRRNSAYSDVHHLFAAHRSYNGSRSNKPYGEDTVNAEDRRTTLENVGRGGSLNDEPESSNYSFTDVWQTWIGRRGDVARAMFYMDVRYEGGTRDDGEGEPDLQLTNDISKVITLDVWETSGDAFMGLLDSLLEWHLEDPVDDLERRRNTVVFLFQGNRNPFIDHPEFAGIVYGTTMPTDTLVTGTAWINEFHYDNVGGDTGEFVEIAGTAGLDLTGWRLVGYNGNGGREYDTVPLEGSIPDQQNGLGTLAFAFPGLQNGGSDGIALIDAADNVVQLLSYEGSFTATDGLAEDEASAPVGVAETSSTPAGHSLQLTGQGDEAGDFQWSGPAASSPGEVNSGQSF